MLPTTPQAAATTITRESSATARRRFPWSTVGMWGKFFTVMFGIPAAWVSLFQVVEKLTEWDAKTPPAGMMRRFLQKPIAVGVGVSGVPFVTISIFKAADEFEAFCNNKASAASAQTKRT